MTLKAITVSTLAVLALAGTACSDSGANARETEPAVTPSEDDFNLGLPVETEPEAVREDDFNLGLPGLTDTSGPDDFNFTTDMTTSSGLSSVPEIDAGVLPGREAESEEAAPEPEVDDIIRLDP